MTDIVFELENIRLERQDNVVLHDLSVRIRKSCPTCIIGSSGSGKTSLLRLLNRLESPSAGRILYNGKPIEQYDVRQLRTQVGFAFQTPAMLDGTVRDNLLAAARFAHGKVSQEDGERVSRVLKLADLDDSYADRDADQLSGGQKQRVALARTLMTEPQVLLLDEPTSALDPDSAGRLIDALKRLGEQGVTVIMVTHRHEDARRLKGDVLILEEGRLVEPDQAQSESVSQPESDHA